MKKYILALLVVTAGVMAFSEKPKKEPRKQIQHCKYAWIDNQGYGHFCILTAKTGCGGRGKMHCGKK